MERSKDWLDQAVDALSLRDLLPTLSLRARRSNLMIEEVVVMPWDCFVAYGLLAMTNKGWIVSSPADFSQRHFQRVVSVSLRDRYTEDEAKRLIEHAEKIYRFCSDLLPTV